MSRTTANLLENTREKTVKRYRKHLAIFNSNSNVTIFPLNLLVGGELNCYIEFLNIELCFCSGGVQRINILNPVPKGEKCLDFVSDELGSPRYVLSFPLPV